MSVCKRPACNAFDEEDRLDRSDGPVDFKPVIVEALRRNGLMLANVTKQLVVHSHCAGMDAPAFALKLLGVKANLALVTEKDPSTAFFHLLTHQSKHLISDISFACAPKGPCVKHNGSMCDLPHEAPDIIVGSFVCKPRSKQNPQRHHADPCKPPGEANDTDTFYHLRATITKYAPPYFLLENVDGVNMRRGPEDETSPLQYMLDDTKHGLRTIVDDKGKLVYTVEASSANTGVSVNCPQRRPRTLFFGCKCTHGRDAKSLVRMFHNLETSCGNKVWPIDAFLTGTKKEMQDCKSNALGCGRSGGCRCKRR